MDYDILARNNGFKCLNGCVSYKHAAFHVTTLTNGVVRISFGLF